MDSFVCGIAFIVSVIILIFGMVLIYVTHEDSVYRDNTTFLMNSTNADIDTMHDEFHSIVSVVKKQGRIIKTLATNVSNAEDLREQVSKLALVTEKHSVKLAEISKHCNKENPVVVKEY